MDIELIGNFAFNRYTFRPVDRETTFGVVNQVTPVDDLLRRAGERCVQHLDVGIGCNTQAE